MKSKSLRQPVIGVMGPGNPDRPEITDHAYQIGKAIAGKGWALLTGGRAAGVMDAASKGASDAGGNVIGVLPGENEEEMSDYVTIPIFTGMGSARNVVNILSSNVVIICGMGPGTSSEASLAVKYNRPVIFTMVDKDEVQFFSKISGMPLPVLDDIELIVKTIDEILENF